jgi:glycosyltransferase involved in cell wall biosynthesis
MQQLIVISNFSFTSRQGAAYSRLLCYSHALENEFNVIITSRYEGDFDEIFENTLILNNLFLLSSKKGKQKTKIYRLLFRHFDFLGSYRYLRNVRKALNISSSTANIFLFYSSDFALAIVALIYLKVFKQYKVFIEKSELEIGITLNQNIKFNLKGFITLILFPFHLSCSLIVDFMAPFFSGIIVISKKLEKLYGRFNRKMIYIPILTDTTKFILGASKIDNSFFYIGYTGAISRKKDGIFEFIKALGILPQIYKDEIKFNIYGEGNKEDVSLLNKIINIYQLHNVVIFKNTVPAQNIPEILVDHDLLVITRASNIQTEYGFSTKLAEYLASGVLVLATKVSDNPYYLSDVINSLLVDPGDINAIALKIIYAIDNRNKTKNIGLEGRKLAMQYFHYSLYSETFKEFLLETNK